jgi:hypothetical protein
MSSVLLTLDEVNAMNPAPAKRQLALEKASAKITETSSTIANSWY